MNFNFLSPVSDLVLAHNELLSMQAIGRKIRVHSSQNGIPNLDNVDIAIIGVLENRNGFNSIGEAFCLDEIRKSFYSLFPGSWSTTIADLGDINRGESVEDTYFALKTAISLLVKKNIIPLILGGTQDLTYANYRAYDNLIPMVNIVNVDCKFDLGDSTKPIKNNSFIGKIILDQPYNLFNYAAIGYQTYFNSQEEIDLMERLFFDAYRLGDIASNIQLAEPVLRNAHLVSLDMRAVRGSEMALSNSFSPNGFTGREICAIARYAGISDNVSLFGVYEMENSNLSFQLTAQIIWYFIEGLSYRIKEIPSSKSNDFTKFTVPTDSDELVFYKSHVTQRWWVEVPSILPEHTKTNSPALLPCAEQDYLDACNQDIPERWFKAYKKGFN